MSRNLWHIVWAGQPGREVGDMLLRAVPFPNQHFLSRPSPFLGQSTTYPPSQRVKGLQNIFESLSFHLCCLRAHSWSSHLAKQWIITDKRQSCRIDTTFSSNSRILWLFVSHSHHLLCLHTFLFLSILAQLIFGTTCHTILLASKNGRCSKSGWVTKIEVKLEVVPGTGTASKTSCKKIGFAFKSETPMIRKILKMFMMSNVALVPAWTDKCSSCPPLKCFILLYCLQFGWRCHWTACQDDVN